ncbi:MAG: metalloregulator ArsR/SmtB family transcription factor [Ardenticatenia bacterium]|nr:metalloregulator ArsR/SmtB family transcription factor [Ardenticatenia bacterium]
MQHNTPERRQQKEQLYRLFAHIGKALANPHRLELLDLLVQAPRTVEELAREANMSVANTSQHLQRLKQARLVMSEREGVHIRYRVADPAVTRLWLELRAVAKQQLAEVERTLDAYRHRRHEFERISADELRVLMRRGEVILLDVRPREEYQAGHLPGAISVPLDELERRLNQLPRDRTVVAYCRGPYCVYADEALELLANHGWRVARLEEGVAEWEQAGYPVERSPHPKP